MLGPQQSRIETKPVAGSGPPDAVITTAFTAVPFTTN